MIILTVILSGFCFVLYKNFESKLFSDVNIYLQNNAEMVENSINNRLEKEKLKNPDYLLENNKYNQVLNSYIIKNIKSWSRFEQSDLNFINTMVQVFDNKGKIVFSSKDMPDLMNISDEAYIKIQEGKDFYEEIAVDMGASKDMNMRFLTRSVKSEKILLYIIRVGSPLITLKSSLNILRLILFLLLPLTVVLTGIMGAFFAQITLRPVNQMITTIHHITAENLNLRLDVPNTKDEIKKLADTFNDMLDRLDKSFSSQRRLIEDLSHEIKTPLAIIKGEIEVAMKKERNPEEYKEILLSNLEEINRIAKIAENLLLISRFESKVEKINIQEINLNTLLNGIIDDIKILAEEKNISINNFISKEIVINGDFNQIKGLFLNLLDNAIKYTKSNGIISINLSKINNFAKIEINDTGIGIPEDDLPYIFDRFYRAIKSNNKEKGFGLGLSIAKSIVDIHHGKIEISSKINKGTSISIYLPI